MQREFQILEYSLNKGNGGLSIVESREVANALDALAKRFNELAEENDQLRQANSVPPTGPKKPPKGE